MPRKSIPRAFKLACKHYRGFDRHFATKAFATRKLQASQGAVNQKLASSSDAKYGKASGTPLEVKSDPMYQYAKMGRRDSTEGPRRLTLTRRTSDRLAIKWYGSLDKRPIAKVSTGSSPSSRLGPPSGDKARVAAAWSAYADLDGPKH
ncbi:hypothetical protein WJX73_004017 [Symbiochloris irregularis]|uniref:Uncharacterized protein n=1 Tax=Symbiochloris irregularis TaxID=706552 RepID=A0AAW1NNT5_9CHLO